MMKRYYLIAFVALIGSHQQLFGMFPFNFFRPYDMNVYKPYRGHDTLFDFAVAGEFGIHTFGRSAVTQPCDPPKEGCDVNVMRVWQKEQNSLAMLKGFPAGSEIASLGQQLNIDDDNGVRGHFCFSGNLDLKANVIFSQRFYLPYNFIFGLYFPVLSMKVTTCYEDLTQMITAEDFLTKDLLTNNIAANVKKLGCLDINGWNKTGVGDLAAIFDYAQNFPQGKPLLKNVRTKARFGFTFPTGRPIDPNEILSVPFGFDGAFGLVFGAGLDLRISYIFQVGLDVEFLQLFSNIRERRIKTAVDQTELLLLATTCAAKEFGFTQRFNLYAELYRLFNRLSFTFTYQYWRHDDDKLALVNNEFSSAVANTAKSLEEWTIHNFIYKLAYDTEADLENSPVKPYFALFYKQPINGKNAFLAHTAGFIASISY